MLRLEVSAEALATFRQAVAKLRRDTQGPLDEEAAVLMMARHVLAGSADSGRANYQIALTVCDRCGRGFQQGRGELVEVGSEIVEMAECDAQHIGHTHVGGESNGSEAGASKRAGTRPGRARQTIPPAIRRLVMRRDGGRCAAPGCKNAVFLDIHHIDPIAEGGDHDPDRLLLLCGAHHRAQHRGQLIIEGTVSTGFTFRHADGTTYGGTVSPRIAEAHALAFRALRSLGFRETDARDALEQTRTHVGNGSTEVTTSSVLRAALVFLGGRKERRSGAEIDAPRRRFSDRP